MAEQVLVTIDPKTGRRTLEVKGVMGGACEDITKAIMQANEVEEYKETGEMCAVQESPDYIENLTGE